MNNGKKVLVGIVVVLALTLGAVFFSKDTDTVIERVIETRLGAVSTLDGVDNPYITVNGQREWRGRMPLMATSSVICSIGNPFTATSSIISLSAESTNVGIAAANNLFWSTTTSASRFASTTSTSLAKGFAMGTGQWSYEFSGNVATSSNTTIPNSAPLNVLEGRNDDGSSNYILGPTDYLIGQIATSTAGTFVTYDQGFCSAVFKKV